MRSETLNPMVKAFLAGSCSGTCSTIMFQPLDLIKTRLQQGHEGHQGGLSMRRVVGEVVTRQGGVLGLWRGLGPSLARTVPGVGLYFSSVTWLRENICDTRPTCVQSVLVGGLARGFAGSVLIPATVIKTRLESGLYSYNGVVSALKHIIKTEGVRGLTAGLGPTLARDVPFSGLYLMFYEQLKQQLTFSCSTSTAPTLAGLGAGLLASLVTHPADVIKTRMQLSSDDRMGVLKTTKMMYRHRPPGTSGVLVFYRGLVPRMMRRTLMSALAWTVYERLNRGVGFK